MLEIKNQKQGGITMVFKVMVEEPEKNAPEVAESRFRDPSQLSPEQLTDPDYALKQLEKINKGKLSITCSKCHHCR